jgi:hypothetical protein
MAATITGAASYTTPWGTTQRCWADSCNLNQLERRNQARPGFSSVRFAGFAAR